MIELKNVSKRYNEYEDNALDNISITITDGEYYFEGKDISGYNQGQLCDIRKEKIGFVFQHFALMDHYSSYENVELPLLANNVKKKTRKILINNIFDELEISELINKNTQNMSGGQRQRVAIARALVSGANIILADEPTGALDQKTGQDVMNVLKKINESGKTVIIVTHDENIANKTNRIVRLCDGKIVSDSMNNIIG